MIKHLENLAEDIKELIALARETAGKDISVYLVGGFVRDLLLGAKNLDLDIVVEGNGIGFAEGLANSLKAKVFKHSRFGTATIILRNHHKIDIASARKETYPKPASLPVVTMGSLRDDLKRRDFTINAMAISITGSQQGSLIDFFGGKEDLENKRIRILHDLSFIDDPTRILRAIRFEQRYNFRIEPETFTYLKEALRLKMLEKVSHQRLRDELILILKERRPIKSLKRIAGSAGFSFISKRLSLSGRVYKLLSSIERELEWFTTTHNQRRPIDAWLVYLMGLLDTLSLKETNQICKRLVFRKGEEKRILSFKNISPKSIFPLKQEQIMPSRIFALLEPLSYELIIILKAKYKDRNIQKHIRDFLEIYNGMRIFISGKDLHTLGVLPGPCYQEIFTKVLDAKLEGQVKTREEELALIRDLIRSK